MTTGYTGGLYDGVEIPRTRAEARNEAEKMLEVLKGDAQELYDAMDPMEQMWVGDRMKKIDSHLMELFLYITIMADSRDARRA